MTADHEPTTGEVYRGVLRVESRLEEIIKGFIGRAEYEADQEGHVAAHVELAKEATRVDKRVDGIVRNAKWILGGVGATALLLLAFLLPHIRWA